jgi:hypothetical protein
LSKFGIFGIIVTIPPWMMKQIDYKMRPILDDLVEKFRKHYKPP